jgi:HEPN domain-containing protein
MDNVIISLLKLSEEELTTAKDQYKKGIYHKSLFLFQQSVEKAYKALALDTRQIELTDLKKIGHDYVKLLKKSLSGLPENTRGKLLTDNLDLLKIEEPVDGTEIYNGLMQMSRADFFNLPEEMIEYFLQLIAANKKMISKSDFSYLVDIVNSSNKLTAEELEAFNIDHEKGYSPEELKTMALFQSHGVTLQFIGLMTSPHSEQTRYPLQENNYKCPTEIYTIELPLIKHQEKLMKMAGEAIKFIKLHCPTQEAKAV